MAAAQKKQIVDQLRKAGSAGLVATSGAISLRHMLLRAGWSDPEQSVIRRVRPFGVAHYAKHKLTELDMMCGQVRQKFSIRQRWCRAARASHRSCIRYQSKPHGAFPRVPSGNISAREVRSRSDKDCDGVSTSSPKLRGRAGVKSVYRPHGFTW
ncbi:MAG: hypothetical protein JWS10_869 [Cypionkella sp.]|nr:hypothetical protein [Cypionkella sp.]